MAAWLLGQASLAAGFDCQKARTRTERAICADEKLSVADEVMSAAYPLLEGAGAEAVSGEQRAWLRRRDACGADVACLRLAYRERLKAFTMPEAGQGEALVSCHGPDERVVITPAPAGSTTGFSPEWRVRVPARRTVSWKLPTTQRHLDCQFASGRLVRVMTDHARRYPYGECGAAPHEDVIYSVWVDKAKAITAGSLFSSCYRWSSFQVKTTVSRDSIRVCYLDTHKGEANCEASRLSAEANSPDLDEFPDGPEKPWLPVGSIVVEHAGDPALCGSMAEEPARLPPGAETDAFPRFESSGPSREPTTQVSRFDLDNDGREETVVAVHHERRDRESSHLIVLRDDTTEAALPPLVQAFVLPHVWAGCPGGWAVEEPEHGEWDDAGCRIPLRHFRPGGKPYSYDVYMLRLTPFRLAGQTYLQGLGPGGGWRREAYPTVIWKPKPDGSADEVCVFRQVVKQL